MKFFSLILLIASASHPQQPAHDDVFLWSGSVVNAEDGTPVPSGGLVLYRRQGQTYNLRIRDGRFSGEVSAGEGYGLMIRARGFADYRLNNVSVYRGMEPLTIPLRPTKTLRGRVVDPQGRGLAQTQVALAFDAEGENSPMGVLTDEEGHFRMDFATDPGTYYLVAFKAGYQQKSPLPFDHPSVAEVRIEMSPRPAGQTGSISGVATMGGRPLAGQQVRLIPPKIGEIRETQIDSRGEFQFLNLTPGPYQLELLPARSNQSRLHLEVAPGEVSRAEFALFEGGISGIVSNAQGEPVPNLFVNLSAGETEDEPVAETPEERDAWRRRSLREYVFHSAQTDSEGRFEFAGVEPGPYLLRVRGGPGSDYQEQHLSVEIPADESLRIVVEPGLTLRGVLLDPAGELVPEFWYSIGPAEGWGSGLSAPVASLQGLFLISGLKPAVYSFRVGLPDGSEAEGFVDLNRGSNVLFQMPALEGDALQVRYERQ